jgi:integrase
MALSKNDSRYWLSRLYKETRGGHADIGYSVRIAHGGRRERFQLATANKYEGAAKARDIYESLVARGWDETLFAFKTAKAEKKSDATMGEFLAELRELHASKVRTIETYAGSLRKIAASIAGLPSGYGGPQNHRLWREKVDTLKLAILTPAKVQKWREAFLVQAGNDPVKQRSAKVSVNMFLREARSLFSPRYIEGLDAIVLPNPLPFAGVKMEKRVSVCYQSTFDVMGLVRAASEELASNRPEEFKTLVLAVMAGLRRNEIDKLEWSHFNWLAGTINVAPTEFLHIKSETSARTVWLPSEMLQAFRGYCERASGRFVIESIVKPVTDREHYRCAGVFDHLIAWLRVHGVTGQKPLHAMRKEYGSLVSQHFGLYAAQRALGHASIQTTASHYLEVKERPVVALGHLLPAPKTA